MIKFSHPLQRIRCKGNKASLPLRSLVTAVALGCVSLSSFAADDPALTWNGITLYGIVDVAVSHEQHGAPLSQDWAQGELFLISKASNRSITTITPGGLSQSRLGLRGKEKVAADFDFIFNAEMGFNPISGKLADGPASLINNNGVAQTSQKSGSDSSRAGQLFNGVAYAGFSSKQLGTLTVGRNSTFLLDNIGKFDPMNSSYAFSLIGYSGIASGGGNTENARLDDTLKYLYKYELFHVGALYQFGKSDSSPGEAWQGNVGIDYQGLSIDSVYAHKKDSISLASLNATQIKTLPQDSLSATISDNTSYTLSAAYTAGPFKVSGGYEHIKFENPSLPVAAGFSGLGGYYISATNNTAFAHPKVFEVSWIGLKYLITPKLDVSGAYYHYEQNAYGATKCSIKAAANCSGNENVFSLRLDYRLTKRVDVYAGAAYSKVSDGLSNGFLFTSNVDPTVGVRFQF
ncbi:MAG TPA: porin [Rudaea sp.]|jgi:predicted porin|uniref:porin n=1 Tax=Rudaea sp. TaxID=2136325 RepID=UPI002F93ACA2